MDEDGNPVLWPNGEEKVLDVMKDCECHKNVVSKQLMKSSEITDEFKNMTFGNFITDGKHQMINDAYHCAIDYFKSFESIKKSRNNSISLLGQPGCGKTHLLMAIANNLIVKKQVAVQYFPFVEGFDDLKNDFTLLEKKTQRMKRVDVLFIDDLFKGREFPTSFQVEQMFGVINYRYLNCKPIMISSELTVDELCDIDEALGTRIYQMCQDFTVVIKGDRKILNHRLEGLAQ